MVTPVQENEDEPNERRPFMARHRYQDGCVFQRGTRRKVWVGRWREAKIGPEPEPSPFFAPKCLGP